MNIMKKVQSDTTSLQVANLIALIKSGAVLPSDMEDLVYAMEHAYTEHFQHVNLWIDNPLEYVADGMVKARESAETNVEYAA